jgi:hypothetical protein
MSFFPRTVRVWNLLPPDIVELDTPEVAYSTNGRTNVWWACSLILIDGIFRFLLRNPRVLFALAVTLYMC